MIDVVNSLNRNNQINKLQYGECSTIKEFYNRVIEPNLPKIEIALKWNELLSRYIADPAAIFILRKYSSSKINGVWSTRRGMLTKYMNGRSYVGVDNYFAHLFYAMANQGYVPKYEEFIQAMRNRTMPVRFKRLNQVERHKASYPSVPYSNVGINDNNWKLSHILPINKDYPNSLSNILKNDFSNSNNDDWVYDTEEGCFYRLINRKMDLKDVQVLQAHLLRVCNPLNYFLSPKKGVHKYETGDDIGEDKNLISYVYKKFENIYGTHFVNYLVDAHSIHKDNRTIDDIGNITININYGRKIQKDNINKISIKEKKFSTNHSSDNRYPKFKISKDDLFHMIILYINQGFSFRNLERVVLQIDSQERGGGFISKKALNEVGITSALKNQIHNQKELLKIIEIDSNNFKSTLIELLNWINNPSFPKRIEMLPK